MNITKNCLSSDPRLRPSAKELYSFFDQKLNAEQKNDSNSRLRPFQNDFYSSLEDKPAIQQFYEEKAFKHQKDKEYDLAIREFEGLLIGAINKHGEMSFEVAKYYSHIANVYHMKNDKIMYEEYSKQSLEITRKLKNSQAQNNKNFVRS